MYAKLLKWCKDSEVLLLARLQTLGGILLMALDVVLPIVANQDLSVFISNPRALAATAIVNGVATELLRRYRATDLSQ